MLPSKVVLPPGKGASDWKVPVDEARSHLPRQVVHQYVIFA